LINPISNGKKGQRPVTDLEAMELEIARYEGGPIRIHRMAMPRLRL
jgi:hypothetical protein